GLHALLIGCTVYPELGPKFELRGPSNDVTLTRQLLLEHFGYRDDQIVTLVHEHAESMQPTRANIVREFEGLIDRVGPGDQVFVLIAGHGSQMIDDNPDDPNDPEEDGLDEVFLPQDVPVWKLGQPIDQAIRDDQFGQWLDAIRERGAFVFFVADTCHSGTMNRAGEEPPFDENSFYRRRHVSPRLLNDPSELSNLPVDPAAAPTGMVDATVAVEGMGGLIALYAVDAMTEELEHPMPPDSRRDGPSYGRLSWALNWVLSRAGRELTYQELAQQIRWQYETWRWDDVGYMSGSRDELDRQVLGAGHWQARTALVLSRDEYGRLSINAGVLHGAHVGSKYLVYPPLGAGGDDVPAACVEVTEATPTSARVAPCEFEGVPLVDPEELPDRGRCELAYASLGGTEMTLRIAPLTADDAPRATELAAAIDRLASAGGALFRLVDADEIAEAVVLLRGQRAWLRRTFDAAAIQEANSPEEMIARLEDEHYAGRAFGPFAADVSAGSPLAEAIRAMAKALNVRRLAAADSEVVIGDPYDPAATLHVEVERYNPETDAFEPLPAGEPLEVFDGDQVRLSISVASGAEVDVTVLYIDSAMQIASYLPVEQDVAAGYLTNRLRPGGGPKNVRFTISDSTLGLEDVLIIATVAQTGAPVNFVFLEQPGIPRRDRAAGVWSAAEELLLRLGYGLGERSGGAAEDLATFAIHRLSWTVQKGRRAP
ncbi:MAG TPA: caspase family protein, partial [Lacipirellulaceae bacterium]|nr:caspase family protein [Lacipirellulaceae bacterium]